MLTGLELTFMGITRSNSGLFSTPGFLVSPVGKRGMGGEEREREKKGRREKGIEKERKEKGRIKEISEAR